MIKRNIWQKIRNKHFLYPLGALTLFVAIFLGTYIYMSLSAVKDNLSVKVENLPISKGQEKLTFLLLGHGGPGHSGGNLMDSIILIEVDRDAKKATMISIPRDLWVEGRKINEGFVAGGYDLLKHEVKVVTGILPANYLSIDFDGFAKAIDTLGGVDAQIVKPYVDKFYPIRGREIDTCGKSAEEFAELHKKYSGYELETKFECRYETLQFNPGSVHMDGSTALKYVRSRHGDGDFGRSDRQFIILMALKDKIISIGNISKIVKMIDQLARSVNTNMTTDQIKSLLTFMREANQYQITSVHLTDENVLKSGTAGSGAFILVPRINFDSVQKYIKSKVD